MARAAYRVNDTRPLLPLQGRADGRARTDRRRRRRRGSCSASTSTTSATTGRGSGPPAEAGAAFPLVAAGFTKADVRAASRRLGLRTWDKPAAACLASRVPYGTEVTVAVLSQGRAGRGRAARRSASPRCASATTATRRASRSTSPTSTACVAGRAAVVAGVRAAGYRYVTLDLEGFRSGTSTVLMGSALGRRADAARRSDVRDTVAGHEAGDDDQLLGRLPRRRARGSRSWRRPASTSCGCPRRTASTPSARSATSPPRPSGSRSAPGSSTCSRARPPPSPRPPPGCDFVSDGRFILGLGASGPAGHRGLPRRARTRSRCRGSASTSTCAG